MRTLWLCRCRGVRRPYLEALRALRGWTSTRKLPISADNAAAAGSDGDHTRLAPWAGPCAVDSSFLPTPFPTDCEITGRPFELCTSGRPSALTPAAGCADPAK